VTSVADISLPPEGMVPRGCRRCLPTAAEMRVWRECIASAFEHGCDLEGLHGPYWFTRDNDDDDGVRGVCRRLDGGNFAIYVRCGLPALQLTKTIFHELYHAFDEKWEIDVAGREARADAFARRALRW
jgi:hypothetical protein